MLIFLRRGSKLNGNPDRVACSGSFVQVTISAMLWKRYLISQILHVHKLDIYSSFSLLV